MASPVTFRGLFAEDFGRPFDERSEPVGREIELAPSPETVPLDEHKQACARAWADGHQAGVAAERAEQGAKALALFSRLEQIVVESCDARRTEARADAEALAGVLCACMGAAFPMLNARHGAAEVEAVIAEILPELTREARLCLRIAPMHVEAMTRLMNGAIPAGVQVRMEPDADLTEGDFTLEWSHGEARRDSAGIWRRIEAILAPQGLLPDLAPPADQEKEIENVD